MPTTWSYSGDPSDSDKDHVRFLIGDTDQDDQLTNDQEILAALTMAGDNVYQAAALICDAIAAKWAKKVDRNVGTLSISYQQRFDHYQNLAKRMREMANTGLAGLSIGVPVLGGGGDTYLGEFPGSSEPFE